MTTEPNATAQAIEAIRVVIADDAYVFLDDEADHFVAEAFLIAVATLLIQSFAKGFTDRASQRSETWGRELADWLADRVERVLGVAGDDTLAAPGDTAAAAVAAEPLVSAARAAAAGSSREEIDVYATASEAALAEALRERGLTAAAAARIAAEVREAGIKAIRSA
jgi:hypothetical protein